LGLLYSSDTLKSPAGFDTCGHKRSDNPTISLVSDAWVSDTNAGVNSGVDMVPSSLGVWSRWTRRAHSSLPAS
jgi:hypothetical protein